MKITILGLSITSSWGNGHATIYRALMDALQRQQHDALFLECDRPWYRSNRDLPHPPWGRTELYNDLADLQARFTPDVRDADLVVVGSYVPDGVNTGRWVTQTAHGVTAFYDIDTPVTLSKLDRRDYEYMTPELAGDYDLYLSFTSGPLLEKLHAGFGTPRPRAFHCCVDARRYTPVDVPLRWDLGYLGTYSDDRQPTLQALLLEPASLSPRSRFIVAGPQYPERIHWPDNCERVEHLPPGDHPAFYSAQRYTLNVTRADMIRSGYAPSVRLFEAAACGTPIISDWWPGLDTFFEPDHEILIAHSPEDTLRYLRDIPDHQRRTIAHRARRKALREHTATHRVQELVAYVSEVEHARAASVRGNDHEPPRPRTL